MNILIKIFFFFQKARQILKNILMLITSLVFFSLFKKQIRQLIQFFILIKSKYIFLKQLHSKIFKKNSKVFSRISQVKYRIYNRNLDLWKSNIDLDYNWGKILKAFTNFSLVNPNINPLIFFLIKNDILNHNVNLSINCSNYLLMHR